MKISRKASIPALAGLVGILGGCAIETSRIIPSTDVLPLANSVSVRATASNQTLSQEIRLSHRQPIPLSEDRRVGLYASLDANASHGDYNRAERQDFSANTGTVNGGFGGYLAGDNGKFLGVTGNVGYAHADTDGQVSSRGVQNFGGAITLALPTFSDNTLVRANIFGNVLNEESKLTDALRGFDSSGNGYSVGANVMLDLWSHMHTNDAGNPTTLARKVAATLGAAYSEMDRTITGSFSGQSVRIKEEERRALLQAGILFYDADRRFYVQPFVRADFADSNLSGNTSSSGQSQTRIGGGVQGGYNFGPLLGLTRVAPFLEGQLFYMSSNHDRKGEFGGTFGVSFNY